MRAAISVALLTIMAQAAWAGDSGQEVIERQIGRVFCLVKDFPPQAGLAMMVTPGLAERIREAVDRNEAIAAAAPDEKPPLGDGIPFQSAPDVSPQCEVGTVTGSGAGAIVEVRHAFPDAPSANYVDRLVLGRGWNEGLLGIDDVLYGAEGDNGSLRRALVEMFD